MKHRIIYIAIMIVATTGILLGTSAIAETGSAGKTAASKKIEKNETDEQYNYGIGSVSKIITATAVMQLAEKGLIDIDAPLVEYIPEFEMQDERYRQITPRMLLDHTSGLMGSNYNNSILLEDNDTITHNTLLQNLKRGRLKAAPGQFAVYCNDGFTLAELLVERVSGMSFTDYLEQNIFQPLQMYDSGTPQNMMESDKQIKTYFGKTVEIATEYANIIGSGGIISTSEDMCRFSEIFMENGNKLLSKNTINEMIKSVYETSPYGMADGDTSINYGLGWDSVELYPFNRYGIKAISKGGDLFAQHANMTVLPEKNMSAVVLSSGGGSEFNALVTQELLTIALEEKGLISERVSYEKVSGTIEVNMPKEYLDYAGIYVGTDKIYNVSFQDGNVLKISSLEEEINRTQTYIYANDDCFVPSGEGYIGSDGLNISEDKLQGSSKVFFKRESDGKIYLMATTYQNYARLGVDARTTPFAQKQEPVSADSKAMNAWKQRDGKKYYLVNEKYSSGSWMFLGSCSIKVQLSPHVSGLIKGNGRLYTAEIDGENTAKNMLTLAGSLGRDLNDIEIVNKNGREYLWLRDSNMLYINENGMETLQSAAVELKTDSGEAKWFNIANNIAGKQVKVSTNGNASCYIYDRYDTCVYSSYMKNVGNKVILPEGGKLVAVGETGASVIFE